MSAPLFSLRGVKRRHGPRLALWVEHLDLLAGGVTALGGPNGAGKSTLLALLAGLAAPDEGELGYRGRPVADEGDRRGLRREATLVAQDAYLFGSTVARNVAFGLRARGVPAERRGPLVEAALATVGLAGFGSRAARGLSGGEGQRVALARALVLAPRVLLLDEPFHGLDAASQAVFERVIGELPGRGTTVILVTHAAGQANRLADRVITLEGGRPVADRAGLTPGPAPGNFA